MARRKKTPVTDPVTVLKTPSPQPVVGETSECTTRGAIPAPAPKPLWEPPCCYYCEGRKPLKGKAPCCYVTNWRVAEIASLERMKASAAPSYRQASFHLAAAKNALNGVSFVRRMPDLPAVRVTITIRAITGRVTVRGPYTFPEPDADRLTDQYVRHIEGMLSIGIKDSVLLPVLANAFQMNPGVRSLAKIEVTKDAA